MSTSKDTTKDTETHVRSADQDKNKSSSDKTSDTSATMQAHQGSQSHHFDIQQGGQGQGFNDDTRKKLREVAQLLQRAGQVLQEITAESGGYMGGRDQFGGNYRGPFGGFERDQRFWEQQQRGGGGQGHGHRFDDRWGRGDFHPDSSRFGGDQRGGGNSDRFGGFGGPNRPDLAYGGQYYGPEGRGAGGDFGRDRDRGDWGRPDRW